MAVTIARRQQKAVRARHLLQIEHDTKLTRMPAGPHLVDEASRLERQRPRHGRTRQLDDDSVGARQCIDTMLGRTGQIQHDTCRVRAGRDSDAMDFCSFGCERAPGQDQQRHDTRPHSTMHADSPSAANA
jgi:hypothetical protein